MSSIRVFKEINLEKERFPKEASASLSDVFEDALADEILDIGGEQVVLRVFGERDDMTLVAQLELAIVGETSHVNVELFGRLRVLREIDLVFGTLQRRFHVVCQRFRIVMKPLSLFFF